jgi:SAM-dependent methyltransferase
MHPPPAPIDRLEQIRDPLLAALRDRMVAAAFDGSVFKHIEYVMPGAADRVRLPLMRHLLEKRTEAWAGFCLLFNYAAALPAADTATLLGDEVCAALLEAGVLVADDASPDRLRSRLRIMPFLDLWIIGDPPDAGADAAMVPGQTTMQLAMLMPDKPAGDVLDLGCGPGTLALLAARRGARHAVGVDINERAIRMAGVNARLNGVAAEFLAGDMYAPVAGRRFDLVVSQPPYVIEPGDTDSVVFMHAGPRGERLVLRALEGMAPSLAPGGLGIVLADTPLPVSGSLSAHFRTALRTAACDLIIANAPAPPIEMQAFAYAQVDDRSLGQRYVTTACRYLDHLATLDPPGFRQAAVMVRMPTAAARGRPALTASFPVGGFGSTSSRSVDRFFTCVDLSAAPPPALLRECLRLTRRARWTVEGERPVIDGNPSWHVRFHPGALGVDQSLPPASVVMLDFIDAGETVANGLGAYAEACGTPPEAVAEQVIELVRHGLRSGLLEPGDDILEGQERTGA